MDRTNAERQRRHIGLAVGALLVAAPFAQQARADSATHVIAATTTPIKLAIFEFELEDTSAGASSTMAADTLQLTNITNDVRQLFDQSGRYLTIDGSTADAAEAKAHTLHDCNACAAGIALQLGADQSFVGVVRRVSRTEYAVRFQIRDARTGTIVSDGDSGLRMGADYSWSRGAVRLIKDQLLDSRPQQ
jgi:hypothetical protein